MSQIRRVIRLISNLRHLGITYSIYLIVGYLIPAIFYRLVYERALRRARSVFFVAMGLFCLVGLLVLHTWLTWDYVVLLFIGFWATAIGLVFIFQRARFISRVGRARALTSKHQKHYPPGTFISWQTWPVNPQTRAAVEALLTPQQDSEIVLGHFDHDGRLLSRFGEWPGLVSISEAAYVGKRYHTVDLVLLNGQVLIKKHFRNNRAAFVREWYNLAHLYTKANVPAIYKADEAQHILYKAFINGRTLRDLMAEVGAIILSSQTNIDPTLDHLAYEHRLEEVWRRGRAVLPKVVPPEFLAALEEQMNRIHATGMAKLSLTFGNLIVGNNDHQPWLIDFEQTRSYGSTRNLLFAFRRDQDRRLFNRIYGTQLLTEQSARAVVAQDRAKHGIWYAPVDFGNGFGVGHFWSIGSGTGRWESLNKTVLPPIIQGKQILDLGVNNGLMPLLMLRNGAARVVGIELDPIYVERARLVQQIFEWRDFQTYQAEFKQSNMLDILTENWGAFDIISAFCSLYYLQEAEMVAVVRRASELAPMMILQANDSTRAHAGNEKAKKSSSHYLAELLKQNGFPQVEVFGANKHPRPLLIGRKN